MTAVLAQLQAFAHEHDYLPQADPPNAEWQIVLDILKRHEPHIRAYPPGNDLYAHRFAIALGHDARADLLIRFDLRIYVALAYHVSDTLHQLAVDDLHLRASTAPLRALLDRHGLRELAFEEARTTLSERMLAHGFIDTTVLAYFFESA
ncbi:hypothetical protein [Lysobacter capsici]|uniref:hypothetical protein n=1 Tax=Lysobacter capsici TaxID=435897 RepID=UPI001BFFE1DC|nr:hypothetical protein [Lysobacter capsici]QWF18182.1 hypothetical protein KME82_05290 [Lysobacter capsici]